MKNETNLQPVDIYKDPLKKNEEGFGFLGCLLTDSKKDKIQCHICGEMVRHLGLHAYQKHQLRSKEYRKKFGLCYNTPLVSETARQNYIASMLKYPKELRDKWRASAIEAYKKRDFSKNTTKGKKYELSLETKNKRGSCPDQILEEIKRHYETTGQVPSINEFIVSYPMGKRYVRLAERTFGSWGKAVSLCGFQSKSAGAKKGINNNGTRYDDETLKEILVNFALEEKRIPRSSDLMLGLLPHYSTYRKRFGSLEEARVASGIYDLF